MSENEEPVRLDDILKILKWSRRKFFYRRQELLDSGAIFEMITGSPPRMRIWASPTRLQNWRSIKASKGERI